jgi:nitroreductase
MIRPIPQFERDEEGLDRGAPHLLVATIPEGNPMTQTDVIIALTHFDIAAPAYGVGTCWASSGDLLQSLL